MDEHTQKQTVTEVALANIRTLSILAVVTGVCALLADVYLSSHPYAQSAILNIGSGLVTAGILSFLIDLQTKKINDLVSESVKNETIAEFRTMLHGPSGLTVTIKHEMDTHNQDSRTTLWEILRSILTDDGQRRVFAAGIVNAFSLWSGRIPEDFLQSQCSLRILLKDGYTFFTVRKEEIKGRFRHEHLKTKILILHPSYKHMGAVAEMDPMKITPVKQVHDCRVAIRTMQEIREELLKEGIDIRGRVELYGYSLVPTWTGFLGDSLAYVSFFFTRPHRGELPTLVIKKEGEKNVRTEFFSAFENEFEELWRYTVTEGTASLFDFKL